MVNSMALDYMHLTYLGVMKKLLLNWIQGPLNVRLGYRKIAEISRRLNVVCMFIPNDFVRKPRGIAKMEGN